MFGDILFLPPPTRSELKFTRRPSFTPPVEELLQAISAGMAAFREGAVVLAEMERNFDIAMKLVEAYAAHAKRLQEEVAYAQEELGKVDAAEIQRLEEEYDRMEKERDTLEEQAGGLEEEVQSQPAEIAHALQEILDCTADNSLLRRRMEEFRATLLAQSKKPVSREYEFLNSGELVQMTLFRAPRVA